MQPRPGNYPPCLGALANLMARPRLILLGGFTYAGSAAAAPVFGRKGRAMLAYLALQPGRPQSRERLAALLWGRVAEPQARMNLRQTLSVVRRELHAAGGGRLLSDADGVTLDLDDLDFDVARFEELSTSTTPDLIEHAIDMYRGDLLEGFGLSEEAFDDWLRLERERLRSVAIAGLERLVAHYEETKSLASLVRAATRLLVLEPLREDVHRSLMRAYAAQGRLALALKQYEHCSDGLQRELRLQPEAETRTLYEELRSRRLASHNVVPPPRPTAAEVMPGTGSAVFAGRPATYYVKSGGCNIAYQVTGAGPVDIVYVPGWVSNLDFAWTSPRLAHVLQRIGSFARLIRIDKRGTGLSDRNAGLPTLEDRIEDVRAVLDAVGSHRTVLFGSSEGGNMCMLFAATYPQRTAALVLNGSFARGIWAEDYPWGKKIEQVDAELAAIQREWGEPADLASAAPSLMHDAFERDWFAAFLRNSASPADAISLWRWSTEIDVRDILPAIHVPTLVVHRTGDRWVKVEEGRYLAARIPGATYIELAGDDHVIWGSDSDRLIDEMQTFLVGALPAAPGKHVLLTILSIDIAGRSEPVRIDGDEDPSERLLDAMRDEIRLAEGREIRRDGHTLLAAFQRPTRAIQCAIALRRHLEGSGSGFRAAAHTGECESRGEDVVGIVVELTSQLRDQARPGQILASRTVRDLVAGSGLIFEAGGEINRNGTTWPFYSVVEPSS